MPELKRASCLAWPTFSHTNKRAKVCICRFVGADPKGVVSKEKRSYEFAVQTVYGCGRCLYRALACVLNSTGVVCWALRNCVHGAASVICILWGCFSRRLCVWCCIMWPSYNMRSSEKLRVYCVPGAGIPLVKPTDNRLAITVSSCRL